MSQYATPTPLGYARAGQGATPGSAQSGRGGYGGGGGGRGGGGGGYNSSRRSDFNHQPREDADEISRRRIRDALFKLADPQHGKGAQPLQPGQAPPKEEMEYHPQSELFKLAGWLEEMGVDGSKQREIICSCFRLIVSEQPHKLPLAASLLSFLVVSPQRQGLSASSISKTRAAQAEADDERMAGAEENGDVSRDFDTLTAGQTLAKSSDGSDGESLGDVIARDLVRAFRSHLDNRLWRNVRLSLHLFAMLLAARIIHRRSFLTLIGSFAAVLDEPGVSAERGDRAATCVIEALCWAGEDSYRDPIETERDEAEETELKSMLDGIVEAVATYERETRKVEEDLVSPWPCIPGLSEEDEQLKEETFSSNVQALLALRERGYTRPAFLPSTLDLLPPGIISLIPLRQALLKLPEILVPPDDEEDSFDPSTAIQFSTDPAFAKTLPTVVPTSKRRRREFGQAMSKADTRSVGMGDEEKYRAAAGPEGCTPRYGRWFGESVPSPGTPSSVLLRSLLNDIIDIYEINRKECARIVVDLPKYLRKGTFVGKNILKEKGMFGDAEELGWIEEGGMGAEGGWSLDDLLVETMLSTSLILPNPPQRPLYYTSLLREVVTLSPQTVAPSIGKSVRRVYAAMKTGRAEAEVARRFADWFSVHLSNFNFSWAWKEWIPDMTLVEPHPKRAFARRIIELEVRLAYYERIKGTLPVEIQSGALAPEEPSPAFTYATEGHPYRDRALALIQSLRARATATVIMAEMESFKLSILPPSSPANADVVPTDNDRVDESDSEGKVKDEAEADVVVRDMVIQALLSVGSRSFSHFLNVVERYHALLRQLSSTPLMRSAILSSASRFWARSAQWTLIVLDKLLQYRIVEPADIIDFIFSPPSSIPSLILLGSGDGVPCSLSRLCPKETGGRTQRDWSTFCWADVVQLTIGKVNGRVEQVRRKLEGLQREEAEEMERKEAEKAAGVEGEVELPQEPKLPLFPGASLPVKPVGVAIGAGNAEVAGLAKKNKAAGATGSSGEARTALEAIQAEQKKVLVGAVGGFVKLWETSGAGETNWKSVAERAVRRGEKGGEGEENEEEEEEEEMGYWQAWWVRAWYRQLLRRFARELALHRQTIRTLVFEAQGIVDPKSDQRLELFERTCQFASQ